MQKAENKQLICDLLLHTLKQTRGLGDLDELEYSGQKETVTVRGKGWERTINVEGDSGTAMICDILAKIV